MRNFKLLVSLTIISLFFIFFSSNVFALNVPKAPTDIPILDQTNTLTSEQKSELAKTIASERTKSSNQIAILMIPSLEDEALEDFSIKVARSWGIGTNKNNGVLLLIAKNDRKLRIEVGTGLEGALTDARSSQIIRNRITPEFKNNNYYEGIKSGLDGIILAIHNEYDANSDPKSFNSLKSEFGDIITNLGFLVLFIPIWITSILARSKSWWGGGVLGIIIGLIIGVATSFIFTGIISIILLFIIGLYLDKLVSKDYQANKKSGHTPSWWAGGGFGGGNSSSSSSGGFGGFGGGSFGGGGSSGSW